MLLLVWAALYITRERTSVSRRAAPRAHFEAFVHMIASMTGFARREASGPGGRSSASFAASTIAFSSAASGCPTKCGPLEPELRQIATRELKRGKVDCTMSFRATHGAEVALDIDQQALERVLARVRELASVLPGNHTVNLVDVLRWPGVVREDNTGSEEVVAAARKAVHRSRSQSSPRRAREGVRLRELIEQRCVSLEALVAQVRARLPEVQAKVRERLNDRLAELKAQVDQERLEQELALLLQRLDVDEELDRLTGHIAEIRRITAANEPAGRRLDFLMQELNREANTLSSKSQDLETTRAAVEMKVTIEQMREQVQNIE